jgi:hypothetical protein
MSIPGIEKVDFYDGRYGTVPDHLRLKERPPVILQCYLNRQVGKKVTLDDARRELSSRTGIPENDLKQIEGGDFPNSYQFQQLKKGVGWSVLFLFGISELAYLQAEQIFFNDLRIRTPSESDRLTFKAFYEEFLEILGNESRGGGR